MKTIIILTTLLISTQVFAASVFDTGDNIRRSNEATRKSIERSNKRTELNGIESEMNRLRGSQNQGDMRQMQQYESKSRDLQRELNK